ncbi:hypothetical protein BQ8482_250036 [Mesorhizobium delmotii]|uniref:Uncharacterized protein n=1 Tax=Mesorhizobium delmotii TaxID=1631247 RepID=A0A2P9ALY7_9HYPH|nr:hypothetical protein BQ8482_250036 [Mesorhizobium delmotii]
MGAFDFDRLTGEKANRRFIPELLHINPDLC